jgi:hypothetical protein
MSPLLEECTNEEQRSVVFFFCGQKDSVQRISIKKLCLSRKAVHNWVEKRGKRFADDKAVETEVRKWLRQLSKDFYAAGVDVVVKRWDKCINVGLE